MSYNSKNIGAGRGPVAASPATGKLRLVLDTCVLLYVFEDATVKHVRDIVTASGPKAALIAGRTGRIPRSQLEELGLVLRREFLPSAVGRRFLTAAGLVPGGVPRVVVTLTRQVVAEFGSVMRRSYARHGRPVEEADELVRTIVAFLTVATRGEVDPRSGSQEFRDRVEANCREAGRHDREELFAWRRRDIGLVDESSILLAVLDRDDDAVLVTADAKASDRAYARGATALTLEEVCRKLESRRYAA